MRNSKSVIVGILMLCASSLFTADKIGANEKTCYVPYQCEDIRSANPTGEQLQKFVDQGIRILEEKGYTVKKAMFGLEDLPSAKTLKKALELKYPKLTKGLVMYTSYAEQEEGEYDKARIVTYTLKRGNHILYCQTIRDNGFGPLDAQSVELSGLPVVNSSPQ